MKREPFKGDAWMGGWMEGRSPRGWKTQESRTAPTRTKPSGSEKGERLLRWEQAAEAPIIGRKVCWESARAERKEETLFRSLRRRKALKGKAKERWRLKEASEGLKVRGHIERVAKP
jgi:hypothetical protein